MAVRKKKTTTKKKKTPKKKRSVVAGKPPKPIKKSLDSEYRAMVKSKKLGVIRTLADEDSPSNVKSWLSSQSLAIDKAMGFSGFPRGRIIEITGGNHTGKSTVVSHLLAQTQQEGGVAVLIDAEYGADAVYMTNLGVNIKKLVVPDLAENTLEAAFEYIIQTISFYMQSQQPLTIAVDSVAGLPTKEDLEKDFRTQSPGAAAKVLRQAMRILGRPVAVREVCLVMVNQMYQLIGTVGRRSYGGDAFPYHGSIRLRFHSEEPLKTSAGVIVGQIIKCSIMKSKVSGVTGHQFKLAILHNHGIDNVWTIYNALREEKYIVVNGSWHAMHLPGEPEPRHWQGMHWGLATMCKEDPELFKKLVDIYRSMPRV